MTRRPIALATGVALLAEAAGVLLVHVALTAVLGSQRMSLAGLDPDAMIAGTWAMGGVLAAFLALCGAVLLMLALRDRAPGRAARLLLISCAITHGVLGAVTAALVGWGAFAFMMAMLALVVASLVLYGPKDGAPEDSAPEAAEPGAAPA
ncbi:hypothetical protein ACIRNI_27250 [Streptomyces sp. NPDC093546]|uniref:hypothetical protein n=1 Tax=Streptomyces sp. NPDC093546 TaxID=3366040 RepID=UPI00382A90A8